jgi:hypothetical protein
MLDEKLLTTLPNWWKTINKDYNYLVLSNDMDSFLSCIFLKSKFGLEIKGYYDFKKGLYLSTELSEEDRVYKEPIYVDVCMREGKCFDNHYSFLMNWNKEMVTLNRNIGTNIYNQKYNGGTLPILVSLYEDDLENQSEIYFLNLLCVDGFYIGCYKSGGLYADINYKWFRRLGLYEYLKPIIDAHDAKFFQDRIDRLQINRKIEITKDGYLESNMKKLTQLPTEKFELVMPVSQDRCSENRLLALSRAKERTIVSAASTFKDTYQYSYKI